MEPTALLGPQDLFLIFSSLSCPQGESKVVCSLNPPHNSEPCIKWVFFPPEGFLLLPGVVSHEGESFGFFPQGPTRLFSIKKP